MASLLQKKSADEEKARQSNKEEEDSPEEEVQETLSIEEYEEEEYIEFPVLKKHKTYNIDVLKPNKRSIPKRITVIESKLTDIKISLKDIEVYEQVAIRKELQPFVLKNSHVIIENLEHADEVIFNIDLMGNSHMRISKGSEKESLELGCIVRYELTREGANSLIVSSRDIDADVEVLGGPCKIEFYLPESHQNQEKAVLRKLVEDDELSRLNEEAGHSIKWLA
ncbi:MAG: hypothetical protein NE328_13530 [Lentisphaeraceae bacterium]|nr:hypothetical protein [Lentisphaeraceae bacterium]